MTSSGWIFLAAMIIAYGVANLLQSIAAARTRVHRTLSPRLLLCLAAHRTYVFGISFQLLGFLLAFLARRELPLFLVQSSVAAGLGVTTLLGMVVLKWRLPRMELALLALLVMGVSGLVLAADPAPSRQIGAAGEIVLTGVLLIIALAGFFAVRLHGAPGSVALGALAGLAFGAAAVAARPLATVPFEAMPLHPLLYLLLSHSLVGQLLLALAMQRGSTTAAVAAMDASAAVPAAAVGLLLLGDRIMPGRGWLAALGFVITLGAVLGLTRHAEPQHGESAIPRPAAGPTTGRAITGLATAGRGAAPRVTVAPLTGHAGPAHVVAVASGPRPGTGPWPEPGSAAAAAGDSGGYPHERSRRGATPRAGRAAIATNRPARAYDGTRG